MGVYRIKNVCNEDCSGRRASPLRHLFVKVSLAVQLGSFLWNGGKHFVAFICKGIILLFFFYELHEAASGDIAAWYMAALIWLMSFEGTTPQI